MRREVLAYATIVGTTAMLLTVIIAGRAAAQASHRANCTNSMACTVNETRIAYGLSPLRTSPELVIAAEQYADELAARGVLDHQSQSGAWPWDRAHAAGYYSWEVGEVIGWTEGDVQHVMRAFLDSERHRTIILDPKYTTAGVGEACRAGRCYYVVNVGAP